LQIGYQYIVLGQLNMGTTQKAQLRGKIIVLKKGMIIKAVIKYAQ